MSAQAQRPTTLPGSSAPKVRLLGLLVTDSRQGDNPSGLEKLSLQASNLQREEVPEQGLAPLPPTAAI